MLDFKKSFKSTSIYGKNQQVLKVKLMEECEAGRTYFKIISVILMDIDPIIEVTDITNSVALRCMHFSFLKKVSKCLEINSNPNICNSAEIDM